MQFSVLPKTLFDEMFLLSAEMQSAYSTAPADLAGNYLREDGHFCLGSMCSISLLWQGIDWLTDWFQWHVNTSTVILCQEIKELTLFYVHI